MGKIVFDTATTINGWIADEDNSLEWLFSVPGGDTPDEELLPQDMSVLVEGSTTYEWILEHEDILTHPEKWHDFHGERPTFVFTTRDLPVPEGPTSGSSRDRSPMCCPRFVRPRATAASGSSVGETWRASSWTPARWMKSHCRSPRWR